MADAKHTVAIIGGGRLGQHYAEVYNAFEDTELVAFAEINEERRKAVGERFGVKALYKDAEELFRGMVPDLAAVVLPGAYIHDAVIAAAEAGVKGVSIDKPIGSTLSEVDEMVAACEGRGVVFAGGTLQRAMHEIQQAASWIRNGDYGDLIGASVHRWGGEISGGGCQHIAVLRLLTQAEISEVMAWGQPQESLESDEDSGLIINGTFRMSSGIDCPIFGQETPRGGVDVWSEDSLISWSWAPPVVYKGFHEEGARIKVDRPYSPFAWPRFGNMASSIRSIHQLGRNGQRARHLGAGPAPVARGSDRSETLRVMGLCTVEAAAGGPLDES